MKRKYLCLIFTVQAEVGEPEGVPAGIGVIAEQLELIPKILA